MVKGMFLGGLIAIVVVILLGNNKAEKAAEPINDAETFGIAVVYLKDGTRCAKLYNNGISCDWRGSKLERPND